MKEKKTEEFERVAMHVSFLSILINLFLSVLKLICGLLGRSGAMISDAVHSASDVMSTVVVIIGVKLSSRGADDNHPYGHERLECVASIILAVMLGATGLGIGYTGLSKIAAGDYNSLEVPTAIAMIAAVISIAVKEAMYWYTRAAAKKIDSTALMADAWHHRSDSLSSIGSFIGILASMLGYPVMDSVASVIICLFVIKAAFDIFMDAISKVTDESCDNETICQIQATIENVPGVIKIDELKTRKFGSKYYVDVEIAEDGNISLKAAHDVAEQVHDIVEKEYPLVKHCMVHVNPVITDNE